MSEPKQMDALVFAPDEHLVTSHRVVIDGILVYDGPQWGTADAAFKKGVSDPSTREVTHTFQRTLPTTAETNVVENQKSTGL